MALTFIQAAQQVLESHGKPLRVEEIWQQIQEQRLCNTEGKTPEATLSTELLRASLGVAVSKPRAIRPFHRREDGTFGLVAWLPEAQQIALNTALNTPEGGRYGLPLLSEDEKRNLSRERPEPDLMVIDEPVRAEVMRPRSSHPRYTREELLADTGLPPEQLDGWLRILERKRQVILQGPPGTGKTFLAARLAKLLLSETHGQVETLQFHPAYAYEDFIQGIRPKVVKGALSYKLLPGRFVRFCRKAEELDPAPCVLILDELNRANLPRVFGELMYLLEYRDQSVPLAAGGRPLRIPRNVTVIGTMNTADRSIARMDHALRRRFAFLRLRPDYDVLQQHLDRAGLPAASLLEVLRDVNRLIEDPNYELGISFFMGSELREHLPDIWECEIEPYLEEFFYDQPKKMEPFRWRDLARTRLKDWS
ncbi:AAA family ATPase [Hyalangium minutum]|uniref:Putative restriction enzyme n=1 Tax=Hyalangium minutum TaxID=394096 RepID=A0A085WL83_9BACT|nr:AAA family ATPase [Hyalangium minutum]KFE68446.1 putative restriction enzyme [Hyalangium minutum]